MPVRERPPRTKPAAARGASGQARARPRTIPSPPPPDALHAELATLVDAAPEGSAWLHEIKLDGYRILARRAASGVQLLTRNGKDWTARAPSVAAELGQLKVRNAVLDGELVSLRNDGVSDFQALQNALNEGRSDALIYYVFEVLFLDGEDLRQQPLHERKRRLSVLLGPSKRIERHVRLSEHVEGHGGAFFQRACERGLEGIVSKRADSTYQGKRTKDWQKSKCSARQELVIGGYTAPAGARKYLGALLLGVWEGKQLKYAGKVGTGFSEQSLRDLHARLRPLERDQPPFSDPPRERDIRWVEPRLVAEVEFTEFTADGRLRHPSFRGLREDKPASEVVRERGR